jgi:hypothetical protein
MLERNLNAHLIEEMEKDKSKLRLYIECRQKPPYCEKDDNDVFMYRIRLTLKEEDGKEKNRWLTLTPDSIEQDLVKKLKAKSYHIGTMPEVLMASPAD